MATHSPTTSAQKVVPNSRVGFTTDNKDEINLNHAIFKFLSTKKEAPPPQGTTGRATTMRERILQVSLFPDIYDKKAKLRNPGNVDFGDPHTKANTSKD